MIKSLFLSIPSSKTYEELKVSLEFPEDIFGISNWVMRFPLTIYSDDLTERHVFNQGKVQVSKINKPNLQERWKYFVITRGDGSRYYCTSHIFYQKHPLHQQKPQSSLFSSLRSLHSTYPQYYLPKCLIILSRKPIFKLQTNLIKIYHELRSQSQNITPSINQGAYKAYHELHTKRCVQDWDNLRIISSGKNRQFSIEENFEYYLSLCNNKEYHQKDIIYASPINNIEILHIYNQLQGTLFKINHFMHLPLQGETLLKTLSAILLEKQIIFTSLNQNLNLMVMETFREMILPFQWDFMYVPNMPIHMLDAIEQSFMPFLVGIHKKYLSSIECRDKIIVYLDSNSIDIPESVDIRVPSCVSYFFEKWENKGKEIMKERDLRVKSIHTMIKIIERANQLSIQKDSLHKYSTTSNLMDQQFYEQFITTSMFQHHKQSLKNKSSPIFEETQHLLSLPFKNRDFFINHKLNNITILSEFPVIVNNEKEVIKYFYQKYEKNWSKKSKEEAVSIKSSLVMNPCENSMMERKVYQLHHDGNQGNSQANYYSENSGVMRNSTRNIESQSVSPKIGLHINFNKNEKKCPYSYSDTRRQSIQSRDSYDFYKSTVVSNKPTASYPHIKPIRDPIREFDYFPKQGNIYLTKKSANIREKGFNSLHRIDPNQSQSQLTQKIQNKRKKIVMKKCGISFALSSVKI